MILLLSFCLRFIHTILFFKQSNFFLFQTFNHFYFTPQYNLCLILVLHFSLAWTIAIAKGLVPFMKNSEWNLKMEKQFPPKRR